MVYLFGIVGFIGGFAAGLLIINQFLKDMSRRTLMEDKSLHRTYGVAVWLMAVLGSYIGVWMHGRYFLE